VDGIQEAAAQVFGRQIKVGLEDGNLLVATNKACLLTGLDDLLERQPSRRHSATSSATDSQ